MENLQEVNKKELLSFFNSINVGIFVHREGKVLYANRYLLDLYKVTSLEDVKNEIVTRRFVSNEFHEAFETNFKSILKGKDVPFFIEKTLDTQGNVLWIEVSMSKVLFNGEPVVLSIIRDVTERIKKEKQLSHVYKLDLIKNIASLFKKEEVIKSIGTETYEYCKKNEIADYIYIASVEDDKIVMEWSHLEHAEIVKRVLPKESDKGVLWYIADTGKKLYLPNVFDFEMDDYKLVRLSNFSTDEPVSYFGVPIKEGNKVKMIVAFLKKGYGSFSELDFTFFEAVASQIEVAAEFDAIMKELKEEREKFKNLAMVDALTGVYTRHFFNEWIRNYYEIVKRKDEYASIVMIDVDNFKKINDIHGHLVGDEVLKTVGKVLKESTRKMDLVVRYGGDEFLMIFPQTPPKRTNIILERIQSKLSLLKEKVGFETTISYGISYLSPEIDYNKALKNADEKMYKMKNAKG
jgi:diguanylate cyclase (GGDEF)-like protein/PAS domain S-box-containing protein